MAELDNRLEHFTTQHLDNDEILSRPIDDQASDHDMLLSHVTQDDPELYALDCCLGDLLNG